VPFPKFWKKSWIAEQGAGYAGKALANAEAKAPSTAIHARVYNWLLRHKKEMSAAVGTVWVWVEVTGCPPVYGIDVISMLGHVGITCAGLSKILPLITGFLAGGGLLDKDSLERQKQIAQGKLPDPRAVPRDASAPAIPQADPSKLVVDSAGSVSPALDPAADVPMSPATANASAKAVAAATKPDPDKD